MNAEKIQSTAPRQEDSANAEQREALRRQMAQEVDAFLKSGGQVEQVESGLRADPPRKPKSQYGSRPI